MIALKEKSDKELLQYNTELKELMRIIDHDRKLRDFMNIKSEDRVELHGLSIINKRGDEHEKGGEKEDTIQVYTFVYLLYLFHIDPFLSYLILQVSL